MKIKGKIKYYPYGETFEIYYGEENRMIVLMPKKRALYDFKPFFESLPEVDRKHRAIEIEFKSPDDRATVFGLDTTSFPVIKRKKGRPKGAKNKPKEF